MTAGGVGNGWASRLYVGEAQGYNYLPYCHITHIIIIIMYSIRYVWYGMYCVLM